MSLKDFRKSFFQLSTFPNSKVKYAPGAREQFIIWEGVVRPLPYTNKYKLCLNYERYWPPRVWIVEPNFSKLNGLPHVYSNNRLCLYHPDDWAWSSSCDIIDTIIRWSMMWIVYYEDYARTGKWRGPEASHEMKKKDADSQNESLSPTKNETVSTPKYLKSWPTRYDAASTAKRKRKKVQ